MSQRAKYDDPSLVREPMAVVEGGQSRSVLALLTRMRASAFQGRQLGEAFETWKRMIGVMPIERGSRSKSAKSVSMLCGPW